LARLNPLMPNHYVTAESEGSRWACGSNETKRNQSDLRNRYNRTISSRRGRFRLTEADHLWSVRRELSRQYTGATSGRARQMPTPTAQLSLTLRRLVLVRNGGGLSDGRRLNEFVRAADPAAFERLGRRHGARVTGDFRPADPFAKRLDQVLDGTRSDEQVVDAICLATVGRFPTEAEQKLARLPSRGRMTSEPRGPRSFTPSPARRRLRPGRGRRCNES
jgi:hypothetical protein